MARLFILGNGFDLAHGYKTRYSNFRDWIIEQLSEMGVSGDKLEEVPEIPFSFMGNHDVEYNQQELMRLLMWLLQYGSPIDDEWNKFESVLHDLDLQTVLNEATMFIDDGIYDDDYSISEHRCENQMYYAEQDYHMYAEALRDALGMIKHLFRRWMNSIEIEKKEIAFGWEYILNEGDGVRADDIFISFNYTETLEYVYGVPESQVFHIHGYRKNGDELIVGHGDDSQRNFNTERMIVADILEEAIRKLRKNTNAIIRNNEDLWELLDISDITDIYSFGFSFSEVDLPYIVKIADILYSSTNVLWHLSSRDHGDANNRNRQILSDCGFQGTFKEYDASKMLLSTVDVVPDVLDYFDRSESLKFYYDESNFMGKFYLKEYDDGSTGFNAEMDKDFVLAGIVAEKDVYIDKDALWKLLGLQQQVSEIKFSKQFSEGDFLRTIKRSRLCNLLEFIDSNGLYIHVAQINVFYYSVVDIVDSVIDTDELNNFADDKFSGNIREANLYLKQLVYKVLHDKSSEVIRLFNEYGYPDIDDDMIWDFCNDLVGLFGNRWDLSMDLKYLTGMIKSAGERGDIIFLQGNEKNLLIDNLAQFYLHFIVLFQNSEHIFDKQNEIRNWLKKYIILDHDEKKIENFCFINSKDDIMVQMSDVVSGIFGQMFEYLNKTKNYQIWRDVNTMDERQLKTVRCILKLYYKSSKRNEGFIFSITAKELRERVKYFADQVTRQIKERGL